MEEVPRNLLYMEAVLVPLLATFGQREKTTFREFLQVTASSTPRHHPSSPGAPPLLLPPSCSSWFL